MLNNKLVWLISVLVVVAVAVMYLMPKPDVTLGFDIHLLPFINAIINSMVSVLLLIGLYFILNKKIQPHKITMLCAFGLSSLFLIIYVAYHSLAPETKYCGTGWIRPVYFFLLISHILLAACSLPFILITLSRALSNKFDRHKRMARWVWPVWFYVSVTGVVVYFMIAPCYR